MAMFCDFDQIALDFSVASFSFLVIKFTFQQQTSQNKTKRKKINDKYKTNQKQKTDTCERFLSVC